MYIRVRLVQTDLLTIFCMGKATLVHCTLDFCPKQPSRIQMYQIDKDCLTVWSVYCWPIYYNQIMLRFMYTFAVLFCFLLFMTPSGHSWSINKMITKIVNNFMFSNKPKSCQNTSVCCANFRHCHVTCLLALIQLEGSLNFKHFWVLNPNGSKIKMSNSHHLF